VRTTSQIRPPAQTEGGRLTSPLRAGAELWGRSSVPLLRGCAYIDGPVPSRLGCFQAVTLLRSPSGRPFGEGGLR
jgi:hypothetical protein